MYSKAIYPTELSPSEVDEYLSKAWFRMGQSIFTTNFLVFNGQLYSVAWLRILLQNYENDPLLKKLKKQNKQFTYHVLKLNLEEKHENLYQIYKQNIKFEASDSLKSMLFGSDSYLKQNIFNTFQLELYCNETLIGCGIFDLGKSSAEGIVSFYHPEYRKYSLGKYLIALRAEYCATLGLDYFYPGYFVPGYAPFDYKLDIGRNALEYFRLATSTWEPIFKFHMRETTIQLLWERLRVANIEIKSLGFECEHLYYPYFNFNLIDEYNAQVAVDSPMFISLSNHPDKILYFDVEKSKYVWAKYEVIKTLENIPPSRSNYNQQIISITDIISESNNIERLRPFFIG